MKGIRIIGLVLLICVVALGAHAQQRGQQPPPDPRDMGGGRCAENPVNCKDAPRPIAALDSVWLEELTWMEVRDALKAGKTTIIIPTGGIEPNGPYLALGKHNYVLQANCEAIARKLGNALCAPIIPLVPEGNVDPPTIHMATPGTISMREETFQAMLTDVAVSLQHGGFKNIIFIGDSGGNQDGMKTVAEKLNGKWPGVVVAHIREYYDYASVGKFLDSIGVKQTAQDKMHDDPGITMNMMVTNPATIRWEQRVKANKATINGVSIADKAKALEIGKKIVDMRATNTVAAIKKAIAAKGTSQQ